MVLATKTLLLCVVSCLALLAAQAYSQPRDSLRFAVDNKNSDPIPPYSWYNHCEKKHQGFNNELYKKIAADLSLQPEFVEAELSENTIGMLDQAAMVLLNKKADFALAPPNFITHLGDLSVGNQKVFATSPILVLAASQSEITDIKQLEQLTGVGVNIDDVVQLLKVQNININVNKVVSMKQAILHLAENKEDFWLSDKFIAQYLINALELQSKVKLSSLPVGTSTGLYMVTNKVANNIEGLAAIDQLVISYQQSGYIDFLKFRVMQSWMANKDCAYPQTL